MSAWLVIALIAWAVISTMSKKAKEKQKQEQREAARQAAASSMQNPAPSIDNRPRGSQSSPSPAHAAPKPIPAQGYSNDAGQRAYAPANERHSPDAHAIESRNSAPPTSRHSAPIQAQAHASVKSSLKEITQSQRHTLEASSITGHAHEETSIGGIQQDCPPMAPQLARQAQPVLSTYPEMGNAFRWDASNVRTALIYAEILGKPKALRRR